MLCLLVCSSSTKSKHHNILQSAKVGIIHDMRGSRGGGGQGTKLAFNVGPSSASQRNAIKMTFCWRPYDGPLIVLFGSSLL